MRSSLRFFLLFLSLVSGLFAQVKASLSLAESGVQPGGSVVVLLKLVHDPHWHTYWKNPGTGLPTEISWKLPEGWSASAIQWPVPKVLYGMDGGIVGNGYDGILYLPVRVSAPATAAAGQSVALKAKVSWLMCRESCVPGSADLSLSISVLAEAPKRLELADKSAAQPFPVQDAAYSVSVYAKDAASLVFVVKGLAPAKPEARFFSDSEVVAFDATQTYSVEAGGWVLETPFVVDTKAAPDHIAGILAFTDAAGSYRGLAVDLPVKPLAERFAAAKTGASPSSAASAQAGLSATTVQNSGQSASSATTKETSAASLLGTLITAFIGGLILNLMPCVFPVLGIKILGFVNQSGHDRRKVIAHGLTFSLGVLLSFWTLAGVLAVLRSGGSQLGWGFQLQSPAFVFVLAGIMLVFAMNMSGVFEFGLSATSVGANLQMKSGYAGSFFTGVLATLVATPCSAPFLAPALGAALTMPVSESFLVFTAIAIGLCMPYLLLSIFPAAVKVLPRPGAWMETFKQFMAFPLYATVGYLVWVLAGQNTDEGFFNVLMGLVLIALAIWVYGRWTAPGRKALARTVASVAALVVAVLGLWLGWPAKEETKASVAASGQAAAPAVVWEKWSPETVAKYRAEGRIVYLDFTARWCATCQANKKLVFHNDEVLREFSTRKVVTLRADWTNSDPAITAELVRWGRSAVPFNLVYLPGKEAPVQLPELLTPQIVLDAVRQ